ncbi:chaperonin [Mycobacterium holsaticum DSM 44478]|nr:chaperonin [Mycolicibacterium holsaticum DSM 44478 = JCM 12374]
MLGGRRPTPASAPATTALGDGRFAEHLVTLESQIRGLAPDLLPEPLEGSIVASVNIKPLEDKILVQANEAETTTASGLVIPDTAKEKPQEGTVVAVGPGRWDEDGEKRIPLDVSEGDTVIYSKYGGTEIKYNGEEYLILSARDVLAVVNK